MSSSASGRGWPEYPFNEGRLVSNKGLDIAANEFGAHFDEYQVQWSHANQSVRRGRGPYLTGPLARFNNNHDRLSPIAREAAREARLEPGCRNPFRSIIARAVEVLYATDEALRIIAEYEVPARPAVPVEPRAGTGHACTEAPRGSLYHAYRCDDKGIILDARIVPPTAQNQRMIENDLERYVAAHLDLSDEKLEWRSEQLIRCYDPCISCATHSIRMRVIRG